MPYTPQLIDAFPSLSNPILINGLPNRSKKISNCSGLSLYATPIIGISFDSFSKKGASF